MAGQTAGQTEKMGIEPATTQLELGLGLSLAITKNTHINLFLLKYDWSFQLTANHIQGLFYGDSKSFKLKFWQQRQ